MSGLIDSLVIASLLVGFMSNPISADITESQGFQEDFNPLQEEEIPSENTHTVDEDSFEATKQTAFGEAKITTDSGHSQITLKNPDSQLKVTKEPGVTTHELTTDRGKLTKAQSSEKTETIVKTPQGELTTTKNQGEISEEFVGSSKTQVNEERKELEELLDLKLEEVEEFSNELHEETQPQIEVSVNPEEEIVQITNQDLREVNTEGWILQDTGGSLEGEKLPEREIKPGETLYVITDDKENTETEIYLGRSDSVWSQDGDEAILKDERGKIIAQDSWS